MRGERGHGGRGKGSNLFTSGERYIFATDLGRVCLCAQRRGLGCTEKKIDRRLAGVGVCLGLTLLYIISPLEASRSLGRTLRLLYQMRLWWVVYAKRGTIGVETF
ncbi:hypothetical protein CPB83DRAFT_842475 [Crepidotus variabilis]|uniref:Uncharacterized protein n=1 Tax=Crepidotus variabilis TaxID=179855 RepID=A0A9P6ETE5_9AGAR|nr:hypothetical protein CPB83DRAFT_842475 [Crepidotus variabilis]